MINITLDDLTVIDYNEVDKIINNLGNDKAYDLATAILEKLRDKHYCVWAAYTKESITSLNGEEPTDEQMDDCYLELIQN